MSLFTIFYVLVLPEDMTILGLTEETNEGRPWVDRDKEYNFTCRVGKVKPAGIISWITNGEKLHPTRGTILTMMALTPLQALSTTSFQINKSMLMLHVKLTLHMAATNF